ncbi:MAG: phosphoribosylamine--glycine ligase [Gammaproteobacteria bacterium]|nr:phosphoribosylamine--glycine ligase [Gammaproteobacteria bacterium]
MKLMVVGSGGREHALAWTVARSPQVEAVLVAPGNPGTAAEGGKIRNVAVDADDFDALAGVAEAHGVDLAIVGPEAPLAAGIRDFFDGRGLACFAPTRAAAQLESSKSFAKSFMSRHGIPTAAHGTFSDSEAAEDYIRGQGAPIVVKADGLAAGKGVVVARTVEEAVASAREMLSGARFGDAGRQVVVEEFLAGEEASFTCVVDGKQALPLASSQDHKARDDGDTGPNTGGMGAYSPAPVVTSAVHDRIMSEIVDPTVRGMAVEGMPYQGFLYVGLMIAPDGAPRVVEYNCRFGDPEAQPVLMRLRSDLAELCKKALGEGISDIALDWDPRPALGVVLAAGGYPVAYESGDPITGLGDDIPNSKVFHAGTRSDSGNVVTSGGRVLAVVGLGDNIVAAQRTAYARVARIGWRGMQYRRDIGYRALARLADSGG